MKTTEKTSRWRKWLARAEKEQKELIAESFSVPPSTRKNKFDLYVANAERIAILKKMLGE